MYAAILLLDVHFQDKPKKFRGNVNEDISQSIVYNRGKTGSNLNIYYWV